MSDNVLKRKKLSEEDRKVLESLLDATEEEVEEALEEAKTVLRGVLGSKAIDEGDETEDSEDEVELVLEEVKEPYEEIRDKIFVDLNVEGLQEVFKVFSQKLVEFEQRITELNTQIKAVKQTEDDRIASKFVMPTWKMLSAEDADEHNEEIVERLKSTIPEQEEEAENVLDTMFWKPFLGVNK